MATTRLQPIKFVQIVDQFLGVHQAMRKFGKTSTKEDAYNIPLFEENIFKVRTFPHIEFTVKKHPNGTVAVFYQKTTRDYPMMIGRIADYITLVCDDLKLAGFNYEEVGPNLEVLEKVGHEVNYPGFLLEVGEVAGKLSVKLNDI